MKDEIITAISIIIMLIVLISVAVKGWNDTTTVLCPKDGTFYRSVDEDTLLCHWGHITHIERVENER